MAGLRLKMEMRKGRSATISNFTYDLSVAQDLSFLDDDRAFPKVTKGGIDVPIMSNDNRIAPVAFRVDLTYGVILNVVHHSDHLPVCRSKNRHVKGIKTFQSLAPCFEIFPSFVDDFEIPRMRPQLFVRVLTVKSLSDDPFTAQRKIKKWYFSGHKSSPSVFFTFEVFFGCAFGNHDGL